ncbi:hypothetical protein EYC84_007138 [Monilinia fructicola]|uniref:Uncharacterized protein n=1 Tax=Monilinia fructicola TaxID=38448 RepID=A0A5M9K9E5_MONFR|nr:hypothetical protein EYC84_007138 [Monilinia fructicola]
MCYYLYLLFMICLKEVSYHICISWLILFMCASFYSFIPFIHPSKNNALAMPLVTNIHKIIYIIVLVYHYRQALPLKL